jgi:aminoglycoside phosphotransferase (APT) family kinase protein
MTCRLLSLGLTKSLPIPLGIRLDGAVTFPEFSDPPSAATLRWVEDCLGPGSEVKMVRPLVGGMAHVNHAILAESRSGTVHRLVLRRWASAGWPVLDIDFSPEREIAALTLLAGCKIPTPSLVAADPSGAHCDVPALLITRLLGHPPRPARGELSEYLVQLAAGLLPVHAVAGGASTMPPYRPYNHLDVRLAPAHARRPALWEQALDVAAGPAPCATPHFIHRDYHPDNTLWAYGRLTGIVDWSNASHGPIAVDVAHMRWNLASRYGVDVADDFLQSFDQVSGGHLHDPYWDLRTVLDLLPEQHGRCIGAAQIPALERFLESALLELGAPARS